MSATASTTASATGEAAKLRVALAGAGMISRHHLLAWRALRSRAEIVAVCDPDRPRADLRADEFGIPVSFTEPDRMLDQVRPDVLDIASPRDTHVAWAEAAAARGIAILCQKPMAPTLDQGIAMVRRVGGQARLMVHENWRFRPWYRTVRRWLDAGDLGELRAFGLSTISSGLLPDADGRRPALERQPFMARERRLMIAEVLIHHLDVARFLCGPLRVVAARAAKTVQDVVGETQAAIFLETARGMPVVVSGNMAASGFPPTARDRLEIFGSRASIVLEGSVLRLLGPAPRQENLDLAAGYQESFDSTIRHFVDGLATGAKFETDPDDNLETLRLVEHAYWAAGRHAIEPDRGGSA
jgi:predicted dehydrogenase